MALITLDDMYQKWKKVSDWVTGVDTTSAPKVTVDTSALPTGAATSAKQDVEIAGLVTIAGHVDGLEAATGATTDAESSSGDGSVVALLKGIRTYVSSAIKTIGSAIGTKAQLIAGSDGTNAQAIKTNSSGEQLMVLTGSNVQEELTNLDAVSNTITFSGTINALRFFALDGVRTRLTVNGVTFTIPSGQGYEGGIGGTPDTTVLVDGSSDYVCQRLV